MAEKRLYDVIDKAEPRGQSVTYEGIPCTARTCVTRLNRLTEENEQLKKDCTVLIYHNQDYRKENEELKKENKKLNCIIKQLEEKYEDKGFSLAYDMGECE